MRFVLIFIVGFYLCLPVKGQEQLPVPYSPIADTLSSQYKTFQAFFATANTQKYEAPTRALKQLENALDIARQVEDSALIASCYNSMGIIMKQTGDYVNAHQFYFQALQIYEQISYDKGVASALNNIAMLTFAQGHQEQALGYFGQAFEAIQDIRDSELCSGVYHNAGEAYSAVGEYDKSLLFLQKALALCKTHGLISPQPIITANIAFVYWQTGALENAKMFYLQAIDIQEKAKIGYGAATIYIEFGEFYASQKRFGKARQLIAEGLAMAQRIHEKEAVLAGYLASSRMEEQAKNHVLALAYHKKYTALKDSLFNLQRSMLIADTKVKYDTDKKEQENELLRQKQVIHEDELKIRNMQAVVVSLLLLGFFVTAAILYASNLQKQKANKLLSERNSLIDQKREEIASQKEDIELKNEALEAANEALAMKNERIIDSLIYGQSVQGAILPSMNQLLTHFSDAFILYKPKDLVSGDFYWIAQAREKVFFAVADCTGHGVPGAFMALLGHAFLHEIILVRKIYSTEDILNELHETVVGSLHQKEGSNQDGMTISICCFEQKKDGTVSISFSGAKMDMLCYHHQAAQWTTLEGDRQDIGGYMRNARDRDFTKKNLLVQPNDQLYFFTDGYPDQANKRFRRFGSSRLIDLLKESVHLSFEEQEEKLHETLDKHQGAMEQRDDITLIGVKI